MPVSGRKRERVCIVTADFPVIGGMRSVLMVLLSLLAEESEPVVLARKWGESGYRHYDLGFSSRMRDWFSPWTLTSLPLYELSGFLWCLILRVTGVKRFLVQDSVLSGLFVGAVCKMTIGRLYLFDHGSAVNLESGLMEKELRASNPSDGVNRLHMRIMRRIRWFSLRSCRYFFEHSVGMRELALTAGLTPDRVVGYNSPIDSSIFFKRDSQERRALRRERGLDEYFNLLFLGRLTLDKGLQSLLQAFSLLERQYPARVRLLIGGSGPEEGALRIVAKRLGLGGVVFLGSVEEPSEAAELMNVADVFVYPHTIGPGMAMSGLEAMACGLPTIVGAVGRTRMIVKHGWNGFLVRDGQVSDVVEAVKQLMAHPRLRNVMGKRAHKTVVTDFGVEAYRERVISKILGD